MIAQLAQHLDLTVYVQDDPSFPDSVDNRIDDRELEFSFCNDIEIVPTLIRQESDDQPSQRIAGWDRQEWQEFTGIKDLGADLVAFKPGCGSLTLEPGMEEVLATRYKSDLLQSRRVELADSEDIMEACFERGWSDGLPVVPPTPVRVMRMLAGTDRKADEIVGKVPPDYVDCSIEKIAINAVMAGCRQSLPASMKASSPISSADTSRPRAAISGAGSKDS